MNRLTRIFTCAAIIGGALSTPALAHTGIAAHGNGFAAGFLHPLMGLDHMLAMLGVRTPPLYGLTEEQLRERSAPA